MTRDEIKEKILDVLEEEFEVENPGLDDNLRDKHNFDSIDAIALLEIIEEMLDTQLTQEEKKSAMEIRTINHILDYIEKIQKAREA